MAHTLPGPARGTAVRSMPAPRYGEPRGVEALARDAELRAARNADALLKWTALADRYERDAGHPPGEAVVERLLRLRTAVDLARRSLLEIAAAP